MRTNPIIKVTSTKLRIGAAPLAIIAIPAPATGQQKADSIWAVGPILTMNDQAMRAEAVALAGGKSLAAGKRSEVRMLKEPTTQLFDLKWAPANTAAIEKTGFVVAMGYDNAHLQELRYPTKEELEAISSEAPVMVLHPSGHLAGVSSAMLKMIGIDAGTKNRPGGIVQRKPGTSEPNGVLDATVTRRACGSGRNVGPTQRFDVITASTTIADTKVTETVSDGKTILKLDPSVKTANAPTDITPLLAAFGGHRGGVDDDNCAHDAMFRMPALVATGQAGR